MDWCRFGTFSTLLFMLVNYWLNVRQYRYRMAVEREQLFTRHEALFASGRCSLDMVHRMDTSPRRQSHQPHQQQQLKQAQEEPQKSGMDCPTEVMEDIRSLVLRGTISPLLILAESLGHVANVVLFGTTLLSHFWRLCASHDASVGDGTLAQVLTTLKVVLLKELGLALLTFPLNYDVQRALQRQQDASSVSSSSSSSSGHHLLLETLLSAVATGLGSWLMLALAVLLVRHAPLFVLLLGIVLVRSLVAVYSGPLLLLLGPHRPLVHSTYQEPEQVRLLARWNFSRGDVYVLEATQESNASLLGALSHYVIVFYEHIFRVLQPVQVRAIMAHELGHWRYSHANEMLVYRVLAKMALWLAVRHFNRHAGHIVGTSFGLSHLSGWELDFCGMLLWHFSFLCSEPLLDVLFNSIMQRQELEADAFSVANGHASSLASALQCIVPSPSKHDPLFHVLFSTHPSLELRLKNIKKYSARFPSTLSSTSSSSSSSSSPCSSSSCSSCPHPR